MARGLASSIALLLTACNTAPPIPTPPPATSTLSANVVITPPPSRVPEPTLVEFPSGSRTLHGFLYRPEGNGPFPTVVFNHGSEDMPGAFEGQAKFFVAHGFVLFVPHRRGQGRSRDAGSPINQVAGDEAAFVAELSAQEEDVGAAIAFVAKQPFVDSHRVAVSGCSLGGIESLFAAEHETGIVAAVDFAGASMTWARTPLLQDRMKAAARNAKVPVFFIQAENDFNTAPSKVLDQEMKTAGKSSRIHIFPPNGKTPMDGHHFCAGGESPAWGPEVLEFLNANMKK